MARGIARAFDIVRAMAENPERYAEDAIMIAPDHVGEVFTPERARLYMIVQERGTIESVGELAEIADRNVTRVSRDLAVLEGYGMVRLERVGKAKRIIADKRPILVV